MVTASTKKELEEAIKNGETEIRIEGKKFQASCYLANEYQSVHNALMHMIMKFFPTKKCALCVDTGVVVFITIAILMTATGIIAMLKKYDVEIDFSKGRIKIKK